MGTNFLSKDGSVAVTRLIEYMNRKDCSSASIKQYLEVWGKVCADLGKTEDQFIDQCRALPPEGIQSYVNNIHNSWIDADNSSATRAAKFSILKTALVANGVLAAKLLDSGIRISSVNDDVIPTDDDVNTILDACSDSVESLCVSALVESGQRISTVNRLTWGDFLSKLTQDVIEVWIGADRTKCKVKHWALFGPRTQRSILRLHSELQHQGIEPKLSDPLVCRVEDGQLTGYMTHALEVKVTRVIGRANLRGTSQGAGSSKRYSMRVHSFRKYFCTTLEAKGMNEQVIRYLMGQKRDTYSKWQNKLEQLKTQYRSAMIPVSSEGSLKRVLDYAKNEGLNVDPSVYAANWWTRGDQATSLPLSLPLLQTFLGEKLAGRLDLNGRLMALSDTGLEPIDAKELVLTVATNFFNLTESTRKSLLGVLL